MEPATARREPSVVSATQGHWTNRSCHRRASTPRRPEEGIDAARSCGTSGSPGEPDSSAGFALSGIAIVALGLVRPRPCSPCSTRPSCGRSRTRLRSHRPAVGGVPVGSRNARRRAHAADWSAETRLFPALSYYANRQVILSDAGEPEYLRGALVSRPFAAVLGLQPMAGRWFSQDEARQGGPQVVIVGEGLWRRRFGGDPRAHRPEHHPRWRAVHRGRNRTADLRVPDRRGAVEPGGAPQQWAEPHRAQLARAGPAGPTLSRESAERDLSALTRRLVENEKASDFVAVGARVVPFRDHFWETASASCGCCRVPCSWWS
jgi:hypothetical protein